MALKNLEEAVAQRSLSNCLSTDPAPRTVQVKLVNPKTDTPLRVANASGRRVTAGVVAQASYTPTPAVRVTG